METEGRRNIYVLFGWLLTLPKIGLMCRLGNGKAFAKVRFDIENIDLGFYVVAELYDLYVLWCKWFTFIVCLTVYN